MISVAASLAAGIYEEEETDIYVGAHGDDAAGEAYADCSPQFLKAMGKRLLSAHTARCIWFFLCR